MMRFCEFGERVIAAVAVAWAGIVFIWHVAIALPA